MMAKKYGFKREDLDRYALMSQERAFRATKEGQFLNEILPVSLKDVDGSLTGDNKFHEIDEGIRPSTIETLSNLKLLQEGGVISAGNASQICDGASGVMIVNDKGLKLLGKNVKPLARIHHMSVIGHDPVIMLEAPLPATVAALNKCGLKLSDIDLFEVNEAFASVNLAWLKYTNADPNKMNVNGGAIALGHPLGASGTRLATTLIHALHKRGGRYGLQTMCEGGGMANVTIFEKL